MKTIIWKELRENWKWALLAMACLLMAELYALSTGGRSYEFFNSITLCSSTFLLVTSFGSALAGASIATAQILPELRRDQWAALLHRPVGRETVFFGKAAAGLFLYFLAVLVPFGISVAYVALPGRFSAPFVTGLVLPGLSDACFGAVFYFAALLVCLHRGRWLGSRGAMALAPVILFALHLSSVWPFLLAAISAAALMFAARGAMLTNGPIREMPASGRLACVAAIFAGACAALFLAAWGLQSLRPQTSFSYTNFMITREGEIFLVTRNSDGSGLSLKYPDGKPVTDERLLEEASSGGNLLQQVPFIENRISDREAAIEAVYRRMARSSISRVQPLRLGFEGKELWFYLVRANYFIGYDKLSRLCVGTCGQGGFRGPGEPPVPFSGRLHSAMWNYASPFLYWEGPQLYKFEFEDRGMHPIFLSADSPIRGAVNLPRGTDPAAIVAIALDNEIVFLDQKGETLGRIPYRGDSPDWGMMNIGINEAGTRAYLEYGPSYWPGDHSNMTKTLEVFDFGGNLLQTFSFHSPPFQAPSFWVDNLINATVPPLPATLGAIRAKFFPPKLPVYLFSNYPQWNFAPKFSDLIVPSALALVLAAIAFLIGTRSGMPAKPAALWALFILCMGLPAFLTYLLGAGWPRRTRCPACRRKRPISRDFCPHCDAAWPAPAKNGSEIFDPVSP